MKTMTATRKNGIWSVRAGAQEAIGSKLSDCISLIKKRLRGLE